MRRAWRLGWRFFTTALVNSLSLFMAVLVIPGISFDFSPRLVPAWVTFALFLGLVNALVRPMVVYLAYPVNWLTIGLPTVLVDSLLLLFVGRVWPGFHVDAFWPSAVLGAVILPASNVLFSALVSAERQRTLYDWVIRRLGRKRPAGAQPSPHGVVFVQIDGLSYTALRHALREGMMPALESLLEQGRFRLMAWDCGIPSQTSSVQAGIMYGDSSDIPAFRFLDRVSGRVIVSNRPEGARLLEQRYVENGYRGLLCGGSSTANVFSGGAELTIFTMGNNRNAGASRRIDDFLLFLLNPYCLLRVLVLSLWDWLMEVLYAWRQQLRKEWPRVSRRGLYPVLRVVSNVVLREFSTYIVLLDILRGVPAIYVTYLGYDEVAHFAGPCARDVREPLAGIDHQIRRIWKMISRGAPIPYDLVILSDHGQSDSTPFAQLAGKSLAAVVRELTAQPVPLLEEAPAELPGALEALLEELRQAEQQSPGRLAPWAVRGGRRALERYSVEMALRRASLPAAEERQEAAQPAEILVLCSGPLAHIYFGRRPQALTLEDIEGLYPMLLARLVRQPGVGFVLGRSEARGLLAISAAGFRQIERGLVIGEDPLAPFGDVTAMNRYLARLVRFPNAGDLVVHGGVHRGRIVAFEEHIGTHGGYGGAQNHPFLLLPAHVSLRPMDIRLPDDLYHVFWSLRERGVVGEGEPSWEKAPARA